MGLKDAFNELLRAETAKRDEAQQAENVIPLSSALPDGNPKTVFGTAKPPMHHVPPVALMELGLVMQGGARKYGLMNWRKDKVSLSTYYDAAMRHLFSMWDGEWYDPESGRPHAAHVMACMAVILDADELNTMNDDRSPQDGNAAALIALETKLTK